MLCQIHSTEAGEALRKRHISIAVTLDGDRKFPVNWKNPIMNQFFEN